MMKRISMLMAGLLITAGLHADRAADYTNSVAKTGDAYAQGDYHQAGDAGRVYREKPAGQESVTQRQYRAQGSRHQDHEQGIHSARQKNGRTSKSVTTESSSTKTGKSVTKRMKDEQGPYPRNGNGKNTRSRSSSSSSSTTHHHGASATECSHKYGQVELNSGLEHATVYLTFNNAEQMTAVAPYEQVRVCYANDAQQGRNPMWLSISEGNQEILPLTMIERSNGKKPKSVVFNKDRAGVNAGKIYVRVHYAGRVTDEWRVEPANGNNPARLVRVEDRVAVQ